MEALEQGTIIHIQGQRMDSLILSRDYFNQTGMVIAAPIYSAGEASVLHVPISGDDIQGFVHLESMKGVDLRARYYIVRGRISFEQMQDISDIVQGIFDYFPYR